jgi:EAL domain-containing protein (putative c-di-GMP-specific phosphodiesterase class I)
LGQSYHYPDLVHIGVAPIYSTCTLETLLRAANEAYEQAKLIGPNRYFIRTSDVAARDMAEWTALVKDCIENRRFSVSYINRTHNLATTDLLIEEAAIDIVDNETKPIAIAPFIAIAENIGKIIELDKSMMTLVLQHISTQNQQHAVAINLSTQSIKDAYFRLWLTRQILKHPGATKRLVFCLSAYAISKDIEAYQEFIELIHQWNCKVMIKRFESASFAADILQKLKPDYIRLALALTNGIGSSRPKQEFVQTLHTLAGLMGIQILAEDVKDENDLRQLKTIGILGANS